jgi:hypothetical protein
MNKCTDNHHKGSIHEERGLITCLLFSGEVLPRKASKGNVILKRVEGVPLFFPGAFSQASPKQRPGHHGNTKFPRLVSNHHTIMTPGPGRVVE